MIVDGTQRWRDKRTSYRPAREVINTRLYEVAPLPGDREARQFVEQHHYSGTYPAARFRYGIYEGPFLAGVAVFSVPANDKTLACLGCDPRDAVELGRLVLLDRVPANGETWFLARCFELLRKADVAGVVSFSDPVERTTTTGKTIFFGHAGCAYQSSNAVFLGKSAPCNHRLLPDGRILSPRAIAKIRARDQGWRYAMAQLVAHGATPLRDDEDPAVWLASWLPKLTRKFRHTGNLKYAWGFAKSTKKALPASLPYPKMSLLRAVSFATIVQ
jgi:hypothetical protein